MQAIVQSGYGSVDVLRLAEIGRPVVRPDEVLVRVRAASLHPDVWHVMKGRPFALRLMGSGFRRPKNPVPGTDMAGHVEEVGTSVTAFRPGDAVFGEVMRGHQWVNGGAFAEYVAVNHSLLSPKPAHITFEQAAAVPTAGIIAVHTLREAGPLRSGQTVLVNGAGGGVGAIAVQMAKAAGAIVTAVDTTTKLEMLLGLGADHAVDHTQQDVTRSGQRYDVVFDVPGNHPFAAWRRVLAPTGTYVMVGHDHFGRNGRAILGLIPRAMKLMLLARFNKQLPKPSFAMPDKQAAMKVLCGLLQSGKLTPVIHSTFPLRDVPQAMRLLQKGNVPGRIVITV